MRIPNTVMKRDTEEIRALNNFNEKGVSAMKILVFGAGVLGCSLANSLFKAGKDVTLLARGKWAEEIKENGLRIKNRLLPNKAVSRIPVAEELLPSDVYDKIFVALRYTQLEAAADALRATEKFRLRYHGLRICLIACSPMQRKRLQTIKQRNLA